MSWDEDYHKLNESDKEQFAKLIGTLLQHSFILQDRYDPKMQVSQRNKEYRFVMQHHQLFQEYLHAGGWRLKIDDNYGYVVIEHRFGSLRKQLDKFTTIVLFVLRLIYEEEKEKLRMSHHVHTTLGELYRRIEIFRLQDKKINKTLLKDAITTLKYYQVVDRLDGIEIADDSRILIYPTILYIVSSERLRLIEQQMKQTADESDEEEEIEEVYP
jgi:hypothetical protein